MAITPALYIRQDKGTSSADDAWADFMLWHYTPSIAAAVIFIILFIGLTGYHTFLIVRRRTWFCIPFVVGGLFEIVGYIGRALSHSDMESTGYYIIQSLGLLLAPILFAASIYMILGRIIRVLHAEKHSIIRVNWLTKIFVGGDIFCFMIQGGGGGLLSKATTSSEINTYNNIILGGVILQILVFVLFLITAIIFQRRLQRQPTAASLDGPLGEHNGISGGRLGKLTWRKIMVGLYASSILILVRNLYRTIEYGMGWNNYLLVNEWPLYVFDGLLMVLVLTICIIWYNPEISKGNKKSAAATRRHEAHSLESGSGVFQGQTEEHTVKNESNRLRPWS